MRMYEELDERPKKRKKKKSRFGYYLYAIVVLLLTIANIGLTIFILTYVQKIEVEGTKYSDRGEIVSWIKEDKLTLNSIYTVWKFRSGSYDIPSYLQEIKVGFGAPWEIKVNVTEKPIVGCVLIEDAYVYFSDDGTVMMKGTEVIEGIPIVEGLSVGEVVLFEPLPVENAKIFSYIINVSEEIKNNDLTPDRIAYEEESMNLYFEQIRVKLGKMNFEEKLSQLAPILAELGEKEGTLHMEHYSEMSSSISFEMGADEPQTNADVPPESTE